MTMSRWLSPAWPLALFDGLYRELREEIRALEDRLGGQGQTTLSVSQDRAWARTLWVHGQ